MAGVDVTPPLCTRPAWSSLPRSARLFRIAHAVWSAVSIAALLDVWACVVSGRRGRRLAASVAWLLTEGAALVVGRGDCPMGPVQRQLGDPVPLFELVLPPRAARAAIPVLLVVTLAGMAGLVARPRGHGRSRASARPRCRIGTVTA